jgi:chromodomain-helicase-DNA-binding protein 7
VLFRGARPSAAPSLMNVMMELRKCCNHPYLNRGVEGFILSEVRNTTCLSRTGGSKYDVSVAYG